MELDTAQPETAAETEVVPAELSPLDAIKQALSPQQDRPRDATGKFLPSNPQEIEAADEGEEPEPGAESHDEVEETDEAAEQAQPEAVELPTSWPADKAEIWTTLEPDAQAYIRQREAEQATAVNAKFMEAANLRKAHEAEISEAQSNRTRYAEAADYVLSLVQPQEPNPRDFGAGTGQFNHEAFALAQNEYKAASDFIGTLSGQREEMTAQDQRKAEEAEKAAYEAIEATARPAFLKDYPDVTDAGKAPAFFNGLVSFALERGVPKETFETGLDQVTSAEWHIIADALAYRELQKAKAKVQTDPKPEPRKAAPAVRPGVTTPRGAVAAQQRRGAMDQLSRTGSLRDGAAAIKTLLR